MRALEVDHWLDCCDELSFAFGKRFHFKSLVYLR